MLSSCFSAGFFIRNGTDQTLKMISKSQFIKFSEQSEVNIKEWDSTSFRLVFKKSIIPYPQIIEIRSLDQDTLLFSISVTVDDGEPILKIVDSKSVIKKGLYVPTMGGGYNFVLAIGDNPLSLASETQPGGVFPYPPPCYKPPPDSIEIVF